MLARQAHSLRSESSVAAWLHRVAWRLAVRSRKRRTAGVRRLVESHSPADAGRSPDVEISLREAQALLHEELAALPERLRLPLVLCYLQGRTREEASRRLGWSLGTFGRRLTRGRKLLHARLSRRGLTLSAVLAASLLTTAEVPPSLAKATVSLATSTLVGSTRLPASLAVGEGDGRLSLWDFRGRQLIRRLPGHDSEVRRVAFSPDDKMLASISEYGRLRAWDVATGRERFHYPDDLANGSRPTEVAFSPDGKLLAYSYFHGKQGGGPPRRQGAGEGHAGVVGGPRRQRRGQGVPRDVPSGSRAGRCDCVTAPALAASRERGRETPRPLDR
jgi:RNA polymerase sigma factor (sigma-70 family)